jgi:RND family efflux transporter MFP subunit
MSEARARINGTLVQLSVKEGDEVKQGQIVAVVSDQRLNYETKALDAQVAAAAAEATRARTELERVKSLYQSGVYAKARLDQAEAAARGAEGTLNAARAQRAASAEVSAQGAVLAPKAGRVLRADVPMGSVVMAGQSVATITAGEPLLRLEIPESQARALKVGENVPVVAQDLPGLGPAGTIVQVYPAITGGRVTADLSVPGLRADLIGQRARVNVKVGEREALIIPARFIQTRHGIDFVRLLGPNAPTDIPVQIASGPTDDEKEILAGLNAGDVILLPEGPSP